MTGLILFGGLTARISLLNKTYLPFRPSEARAGAHNKARSHRSRIKSEMTELFGADKVRQWQTPFSISTDTFIGNRLFASITGDVENLNRTEVARACSYADHDERAKWKSTDH